MSKYQVRVIEGYRWGEVRCGGIEFTKRGAVTLSERELTEEIRRCKLLDIVEVLPDVVATVAALALAEEAEVDLTLMLVDGEGSGKGGRITQADVQRFIKRREHGLEEGDGLEGD